MLYEPEIPPNTGNIMRLCANTGARLHLVEPLGFTLEEKLLRRAALDYRDFASVTVHPSFDALKASAGPARFIAVSTKGATRYDQFQYVWFHFSPGSLQLTETIISRYVDPCSALEILNCSGFIWHPFISSILLLPAAPVLAFFSFILITFGIKKSGRKRAKNQSIK